MSNDLVKRLREAERQYVNNEYNLHARAADRIEKLEAALREIADCVTLPAQNDSEMREIARRALENNNDPA